MSNQSGGTGSELFIVDNSDTNWKVRRYLHDWCDLAKSIDIATGFFEIGALLLLDPAWQRVDAIRLLIGDEVSMRTKAAFATGLAQLRRRLDDSIEAEKEKNPFLTGVPAIVDALNPKNAKITCRVYRKNKFHAKAYITKARQEVLGSFALVGSSNFTAPGLSENVELNVQITGRQVTSLQEWYDRHWNEAEDVTPEVLRTVERHVTERTPFEIYAKALQSYFSGHEQSATDWERGIGAKQSLMYPLLDQYQKDGFHQLVKIAERWKGAFLCDGVGLGKTFIGLMLIEWLVSYKGKNVVLFVPKSGRDPVWEPALRNYLPHISGDFVNLVVYNHSDLTRGGEFQRRFDQIKERADAIIIDEAHHFRNPGIAGEGRKDPSRYRRLYDIAENKMMFLLTATPVNNRLIDLQHMIELFSRVPPAGQPSDYFKGAPLGIHSLGGHFRKMEKELERIVLHRSKSGERAGSEIEGVPIDLAEAERVLTDDALFRALVVQRSRAYVKKSQVEAGGRQALFPTRESPRVAAYELKKTYGKLLGMVDKAFKKTKSLFSLPIYVPLVYHKRPDEVDEYKWAMGRQVQVVSLIRTSFLKRFESSAESFRQSCISLLKKILAWVEVHSETETRRRHFERWKAMHAELLDPVHRDRPLPDADPDEDDVDFVPREMLDDVTRLSPDDYDIEEMLRECYFDLDQLGLFLAELSKFEPKHDDKLKTLIKLLRTDPVLKSHKVLIFTEFMSTARYLEDQLIAAGITGVAEIDSARASTDARSHHIRQFSPYYNGSSSAELARRGNEEIRVLISTDVLSEGLNLQDCTRLINYDLHWNPVRLMQRIGRVDRRLNPEIEARIVADHPAQRDVRGSVVYWNFLPPEELNELLTLYSRVTHKTLRISKTFGIEGKKLLTPKDDYEALKDFNAAYEGQESPIEQMHLEWQELLRRFPDLVERLNNLPGQVFSGKRHPSDGTRAVFFCYALPARPVIDAGTLAGAATDADEWSIDLGPVRWYLFDLATSRILDEPSEIIGVVRCEPDTPRVCVMEQKTLGDIRATIEKHIKNTYLKQVQAPVGVKPALRCWMELN